MKNQKIHFRIFAAAAAVSFAAALSGCGGGGADGADLVSSSGLEPGLGIPAAKCLGTTGPFDAAQTAISNGLGSLTSALPQGAGVASRLTSAVSHLLDSPDALIAALQNLAANQDPQAFVAELTAAGDGLRCGLAYTDAALVDLTQQLQTMGASVPALPGLLSQIKGIETLLGQSLIGSVDLATLTSMLDALPGPLSQVSGQLPAGLKIPNVLLPLGMISNITSTVSVVLRSVAHLDAGSAQGAIVGMAVYLAGLLNGASAVGLPSVVVQPIYSLLLQGNTQFLTHSAPYIGALFTALSNVLASQSNPLPLLQGILMGGITGAPVTGQFANALGLLSGGGTTAGGLPIPLLSHLLALLIPGGVPL